LLASLCSNVTTCYHSKPGLQPDWAMYNNLQINPQPDKAKSMWHLLKSSYMVNVCS